MADGGSIINLGDITKPATVLVERISDAIGGIARPWQIKRVAAAEAEADKIRALADVEITTIQRRALVRMIEEEGKKQGNIEAITAKAIPDLRPDAKPEDVEKDWLAHFFDRCRLVSDAEMQSLWARLLAGEANQAGSFSKRTIEAVATLDKKDAQTFTALCGYCWRLPPLPSPQALVFNAHDPIYSKGGINFDKLLHFRNIGLITFDSRGGFRSAHRPKNMTGYYFDQVFEIEFPGPDGLLNVGDVIFSQTACELYPIAGAVPVEDFDSYVTSRWTSDGFTVYSPWPRQMDDKETAADAQE